MNTPTPHLLSSHTIVAGDTFQGLAKKYGFELKEILDVNPSVRPEELEIGQIVNVPEKGAGKPFISLPLI